MHILVAYDISDNHLRGKIFAYLKEKGLHSQKSVFECEMDTNTFQKMKRFMDNLELGEDDSIVFYPLCHRCLRGERILGNGIKLVQQDWVIL